MNTRLIVRMITPIVAMSLLLLAVGVGAAWYVNRLQRDLSDALLDNVSSMRAAEELEILLREVRTQLDHYLITGDRKYLERIPALRRDTNRWLTEAERWSFFPRERELALRARAGHERFYGALSRLLDEAPDASLAQAVRGLSDDTLTQDLLEPTHEYLDFNEELVSQSVAENQVFANRLAWGLFLLGTCGSAAGLIAGVGFARGFKRSLVQLSVPIRAAAGQLDAVVGPVTFPVGGDLHALEGVLRLVSQRIGAVIERLRESEREVLRSEQLAALGQIAAGMAHELRNPLTSMKILLQAAMTADYSTAPSPEGLSGVVRGPYLAGRDLSIFEEEILRLEKLTQSFLDLARPPRVVKKSVDIRTLVDQAVGLVSGRASRVGARVTWLPGPEPVWAKVDPDQFRQVLLNLMLNGLDALKAGGVIGVGVECGPEGELTLRVTDDGCGLPAHLGNRIFAPFITTKETGLGLGLSICKGIVDAHGGSIAGMNRAGGGAVFLVRLPPEKCPASHARQVGERGSDSV